MTSDIISSFHKAAEHANVPVGHLFEATVRRVYEQWLKPGDRAVDGGAHKGAHLIPMAKAVGKRGFVYGFEPIPDLAAGLEKRLKKEGIRHASVCRKALSFEKGEATFRLFTNRPAYSGLERRHSDFSDEEGGLEELQVEVTTLDRQIPFFRAISAIKLDLEGGEFHALQGAHRILTRSRPMVVFENGRQASAKVYGYTADDFFEYFNAVGYDVYWLSGENFQNDDWSLQKRCWEFVALPKERADFAGTLPGLCAEVLAGQSS